MSDSPAANGGSARKLFGSPFSKHGSANKKAKVSAKMRIFSVSPPDIREGENVIAGFCPYMSGYADKQWTEAIYKRMHPWNQQYLSQLQPIVSYGMELCQENGSPLLNHPSEYAFRTMVFSNDGVPLTDDGLKNWISNHFRPAFAKLPNMKMPARSFEVPEQFHTPKQYWSQIFDINQIFTFVKYLGPDGHEDVSAFFKENKGHVYSFWPRGQVPIQTMEWFGLSAEHLDDEDMQRYSEFLQQQEEKAIQSLATDHNEEKKDDSDDDN